MRFLRWTPALCTLVLVLACAASPTAATGEPPTVAPTGPSASPTATAPVGPEPSAAAQVPATLRFSAATADGRTFDGATLQGKPVLFWFWAPWCPTCHAELPEVQQLAQRYDGQVEVVGVGSLDSADAIIRFAKQTSGFTVHLVDERGLVWKRFGVTEQSSFVLLDADGKVAFRAGYGGSPELADEVAAVAT